MDYRKRPKIVKYVAVSLGIFGMALALAFGVRLFLGTSFFADFSEEQISVAASLVEGAVGAIAAGFVL